MILHHSKKKYHVPFYGCIMQKFILSLSRRNRFPRETIEHQRARLVHIILALMIGTLSLFSILDLTIFHDQKGLIVGSSALVLTIVAFLYFKYTFHIKTAAGLTVGLFTVVAMGAIIFQAPDFHVVIWMCMVPPVAFYLLGVRKGYAVSIGFALVLELYFFMKGFHSEGPEDLTNITLAYAGIVILIAYYEKSREEGFTMLLKDIDRRKKIESKIQTLNNELEKKVIQRTRQLQEMNDLLNEEILVRRNAEEVSNRARLAALEANKVKSEFLSRMSHKLRTPLNSILGFAQVMEMGKLEERQMKNLQHIQNGGKELLSLVNDILEINTIDNLEVIVSNSRFSLNDLIKTAVQAHGRKIMEKNLHVKIIEDPAGDIFIRSDRKLLERLVNYLLDNAVKFNRTDGEIRIQVTDLSGKECRENCFQFSVFDTGIGILEEDQAKIFDMFLTGDTGSYNAENVGLGLTMAKKIVEKLDGTIGVSSRHGEGSHFWFRVPFSINNDATFPKANGIPALHLTQTHLNPGHSPSHNSTWAKM